MVWEKKKVSFYTKDEISITVPKRDRKKINFKVRYQSPLIAPVEEDQYVADFLIKKMNKLLNHTNYIQRIMLVNPTFFLK